jgi:hypothetical protein
MIFRTIFLRSTKLAAAASCAALLATATPAMADSDIVVAPEPSQLVTGEDTCMGSSSIGGAGVGFGISIGTTWTDENCQRLKNARQLASLGYSRAAIALVCLDEDVQLAMRAAGTPCPYADDEDARASTPHWARPAAEAKAAETKGAATPIRSASAKPHFVPMQPIKDE